MFCKDTCLVGCAADVFCNAEKLPVLAGPLCCNMAAAVPCCYTHVGFRAAATPAVLEGIGVSADAALDKMRLMALLVLGSKSSRSAVSFEEIQTALDIPSDQVGTAAELLMMTGCNLLAFVAGLIGVSVNRCALHALSGAVACAEIQERFLGCFRLADAALQL